MNATPLRAVSLPDFISTERLILKRHVETVAQVMFTEIDEDRLRLSKFLPWVESTRSVKDSLTYIQLTDDAWERHERFDYGIYRKSDSQYLGNIGAHQISWTHRKCELGYWIIGKAEGHGYVSEGVKALEDHLFGMGFHRIEIRCSVLNERSAKVPKNCAYRLEGTFSEDAIENGQFRSTHIFAKLAPKTN